MIRLPATFSLLTTTFYVLCVSCKILFSFFFAIGLLSFLLLLFFFDLSAWLLFLPNRIYYSNWFQKDNDFDQRKILKKNSWFCREINFRISSFKSLSRCKFSVCVVWTFRWPFTVDGKNGWRASGHRASFTWLNTFRRWSVDRPVGGANLRHIEDGWHVCSTPFVSVHWWPLPRHQRWSIGFWSILLRINWSKAYVRICLFFGVFVQFLILLHFSTKKYTFKLFVCTNLGTISVSWQCLLVAHVWCWFRLTKRWQRLLVRF